MIKIYAIDNYIIVDDSINPKIRLSKTDSFLDEYNTHFWVKTLGKDYKILKDLVNSGEYVLEDGTTPYTLTSLVSFLEENTAFNKAGDSSAVTTTHFGFMDYNDTSPIINLVADTWTTLPNNGLGAFTNKAYKPSLVNEIIDTSNGNLDFSDLTLGSEIRVRNDFTVVPNTNNALLEARYLLGGGAGQYPLEFVSERLSSGSGIPYQRVRLFSIYMGDDNTLLNQGILQVKLSTAGTVDNAGSYISIKVR